MALSAALAVDVLAKEGLTEAVGRAMGGIAGSTLALIVTRSVARYVENWDNNGPPSNGPR
jgi:hypothetical protein